MAATWSGPRSRVASSVSGWRRVIPSRPGQRLLAIEAMKMENEVRAPRAGTVESIRVAAGSSVELRDELLTVR